MGGHAVRSQRRRCVHAVAAKTGEDPAGRRSPAVSSRILWITFFPGLQFGEINPNSLLIQA